MKLIHLPINIKTIFLIDGLGAFVSASALMLVQWKFHQNFGMPLHILSILYFIAFVFSIYSISCFLFSDKNRLLFLKIIVVANLMYCCLTVGLVIYHHAKITTWGLAYFITEVAVIIGLVLIEFQTWKTFKLS